MTTAAFDLTRVTTIQEACAVLANPASGAVPLAGGTQLLVALRNGTQRPARLVDLTAIPGLDTIAFDAAAGLVIGAGVTLARLAEHAAVRARYPALAEAARAVASVQVQEMGTVGGNLCQDACCIYVDRTPDQRNALAPCHKVAGEICHVVSGSERCWANYAGDLAPVLLALDASMVVADADGEHARPLESLFSLEGTHPIALRRGELITRVLVPPPAPRSGQAYLKLRLRETLDYPLLGVAAAVTLADDGSCRSARLVLTGVERGPVLVPEAGQLAGQPPTDALVDRVAHAAYRRAHPVKNAWGYAVNYRLKMTRPYAARALHAALARAHEASHA